MESMNKDIKLENLSLHCRTCLCTFSGQRHNLQAISGDMIKLLSYSGLQLPQNEVFPNFMCDQCYNIIKNFEEFQAKLKRSTECLEELLTSATIGGSNNFKTVEVNLKTDGPDPLEENADFEAVLVKLEIEMESTASSGDEEESIKEEDIPKNPIEENQIRCSKPASMESNNINCETVICKYGCGRKFRRLNNAEAHYRYKHTNQVEIQNKTSENSKQGNSKTKISLAKNMEITASENNSFDVKKTCNICSKTFATLAGLRSHIGTHGDVRPFQCDKCNRGFNMKARLKRHINEVHQENPPEILCKFGCDKKFTRHESAMNHYRVKHILPEKGIFPKTNTYICEDCGKTFKTMHNLKEHSYTHRPHTERPFQCEQCQKRFISKRPFEIHLLRHAGIKNFECKICGLKTTTHNELRNHMNHHTKAKQVNCPICSKTYTNPDNLRRHTLIVHQGVKNYKCRFCEEKFGKPDHLKHHEMRHTGERPHKCQICDRGFIQLVALKAHMKTHNKAKIISEKELI